MAIVQSLTAIHASGQTFLYADRNSIAGPFSCYRHTSQITAANIGSLTPCATIDANSGIYRHDDSAAANLHAGFKIPDGAGGTITLSSSKILLVWTTASSGTYYYAITHGGDSTVTVGTNSLTSGVSETHQTDVGFVVCDTTADFGGFGMTLKRCFAWEDYSSWQSSWGYYGNRFNVWLPASGSNYPLVLTLHAAGSSNYQEPPQHSMNDLTIAYLDPVDHVFVSADPYTSATRPYSNWFGYYDGTYAQNVTEARVCRYVRNARDTYSIDPNRILIGGASHGSAAEHYAAHQGLGGLFAACYASLGWVDTTEYGNWTMYPAGTKVGNSAGPLLTTYINMAAQSQLRAFPPMVLAWNADDTTVNQDQQPTATARYETDKQPVWSEWRSAGHPATWAGGHTQFIPGDSLSPSYPYSSTLRFVNNEAVLAFANFSNSDAIPSIPSSVTGQRNCKLDYQGSQHTITGGSAISDTTSSFAASVIAITAPGTGDVTVRNAQAFLPSVGEALAFTTSDAQSGSATRNSDGSVTVSSLVIPTSAIRLTISVIPPASATNTARLSFRHA